MRSATLALLVTILIASTILIGYVTTAYMQANVNAVQCEIHSTHYAGFSYYGNLRYNITKSCQ